MFNRNRLTPTAALIAAAMGQRSVAISLNCTAPAGAPG
jgi:hypothetical protein